MKKCKICKKVLKGRSDKIFCSVTCKNYYHTQLRKTNQKATQRIDDILHRNRAIMLEILGKNSQQKKVERKVLDNKKFNFHYHTHQFINSRGKIYYYVYDIGYMLFSDGEVLVVRKR